MKTMKNELNRILTLVVLLLVMSNVSVNAQVNPGTPNVALFCANPSSYDLDDPVAANTGGGTGAAWRVVYSASQLTDAQVWATTPITLSGNSIPGAQIQTGYLYISQTYSDACDSEIKEIPVYVFKALTSSISGANDYCIEDVASQTFNAGVTSADAYQTFVYQWYTVNGGVETVIDGATSATYKPSATISVGTTTTYRVKVAYSVDNKRYCTAQNEKAVAVKAKPTVSIIIENVGDTW